MSWYDEAVFYHIYPLGLSGAPRRHDESLTGADGRPAFTNRLLPMEAWIPMIQALGCTAVYIGPLFESEGHGYETTDYKKVDQRLGSNEDFAHFVQTCHGHDMKVIVDGVFNHTGRSFFAFQDILKNRENSPYRDWYCNVRFGENDSYNDGFRYDNWGGYDLLVKLNQRNPAVCDYIYDVMRFWVKEFDIDGIRLDAADVLDFNFMKGIRWCADNIGKPDFWLMGEVIHGDYGRWANKETLHSVTNYALHKGLYSGHNTKNYFEIAHTVKYIFERVGQTKLYTFVDNHDVERIASRVDDKRMLDPIYTLLFLLPGIPSIYYGSEFGIEGRKGKQDDNEIRPYLNPADYADEIHTNPLTRHIAALGRIHAACPEASDGEYRELLLKNREYAFARVGRDGALIAACNIEDGPVTLRLQVPGGFLGEKAELLLPGTEGAETGAEGAETGAEGAEAGTEGAEAGADGVQAEQKADAQQILKAEAGSVTVTIPSMSSVVVRIPR